MPTISSLEGTAESAVLLMEGSLLSAACGTRPQVSSSTCELVSMPAEARNFSNCRKRSGSICCSSAGYHFIVRAFFKSAYANSPTFLGNMPIVSAPRLPAFAGFADAATRTSRAHAAVTLVAKILHFLMQSSFQGAGWKLQCTLLGEDRPFA